MAEVPLHHLVQFLGLFDAGEGGVDAGSRAGNEELQFRHMGERVSHRGGAAGGVGMHLREGGPGDGVVGICDGGEDESEVGDGAEEVFGGVHGVQGGLDGGGKCFGEKERGSPRGHLGDEGCMDADLSLCDLGHRGRGGGGGRDGCRGWDGRDWHQGGGGCDWNGRGGGDGGGGGRDGWGWDDGGGGSGGRDWGDVCWDWGRGRQGGGSGAGGRSEGQAASWWDKANVAREELWEGDGHEVDPHPSKGLWAGGTVDLCVWVDEKPGDGGEGGVSVDRDDPDQGGHHPHGTGLAAPVGV